MNTNIEIFNRVNAFLNAEADLLDNRLYQDWLSLWSESGLYIVPVDTQAKDFKNTLNIAYDDHHMRLLRVERLTGGESVSVISAQPTSRSISALRIISDENDLVTVRCSYCLYENKAGDLRHYPGSAEFVLKRNGDSFLIKKKLVKLLRASQFLATISYIF
ncbi:hypothetical protein N9060_01455 [Arenicella sp.]|nr:hypothetical protein [Arenicella sp.]